jgi:hypothetical protein
MFFSLFFHIFFFFLIFFFLFFFIADETCVYIYILVGTRDLQTL